MYTNIFDNMYPIASDYLSYSLYETTSNFSRYYRTYRSRNNSWKRSRETLHDNINHVRLTDSSLYYSSNNKSEKRSVKRKRFVLQSQSESQSQSLSHSQSELLTQLQRQSELSQGTLRHGHNKNIRKYEYFISKKIENNKNELILKNHNIIINFKYMYTEKRNENLFECFKRCNMMTKIFEFLSSGNKHKNNKDIWSLAKCSKNIYISVENLLKEKVQYPPCPNVHDCSDISNTYRNTVHQMIINNYNSSKEVLDLMYSMIKLSHLTFENMFNISFNKTLPKTITHLNFGSFFDQTLTGILPPNLKQLILGNNFNKQIDEMLPLTLTHLTFGNNFNHSIEDILPPDLQKLILGNDFNQPLTKFTSNLINIKFGNNFNQPFIEYILPESLLYLSFGKKFNQPFTKNMLPKYLRKLSFGFWYDHSFDVGVLPEYLTHLTMSTMYDQPLNNKILPDSLQFLTLGYLFRDIYNCGKLSKSYIKYLENKSTIIVINNY